MTLLSSIDFSCFGVRGNDYGESLHVSLDCSKMKNESNNSINNKHLILLLDTSTSMTCSLQAMKKSIIAAVSFLKSPKHVTIITYSNDATILWNGLDANISPEDFVPTIESIECKGFTNLGGALLLAKQVISLLDEQILCWLCVMSDGVPNVQPYITKDDFVPLIESFNLLPRVKVVSVGYGTDVDVALLSSFGEYSHICGLSNVCGAHTTEVIYRFFGALVGDMITSFAFDARITFNPPLTKSSTLCRYVVGESKLLSNQPQPVVYLGVLSKDTKYNLLYLPSCRTENTGVISRDTIVTLTFKRLGMSEVSSISSKTVDYTMYDSKPACKYNCQFADDELRRLYFEDCTARLMAMMKKIPINQLLLQSEKNDNLVNTKIRLWNEEPLAKDCVNQLVELKNNPLLLKTGYYESVGSAYKNQTSYLINPSPTIKAFSDDVLHHISTCSNQVLSDKYEVDMSDDHLVYE